MLFTETYPLAVPLVAARDRLHGHPDLERALQSASVAAFADGLGSLSFAAGPGVPSPLTAALTLAPYRRGETSVVALRWFTTAQTGGTDHLILDANLELQPGYGTETRLVLLGSYQPNTGVVVELNREGQDEALQTSARSFLSRTVEILTPREVM